MPPGNDDQEKSRRTPATSAPPARGASAAQNTSSCEAVLARVVRAAQISARDTGATRGTLPSGRTRSGDQASSVAAAQALSVDAQQELNTLLRQLDPEMALKLRTLMIAGRDGQGVGKVKVNLSLSDAEAGFAAMADDSSQNGPLLVEYLRRGHAAACAAGVNLDGPLANWGPAADSLDERAWLSFGTQLATSKPEEWSCIGIVGPGSRQISKLYLKLGDHAWWSFQAVLDRPTQAGVDKERRSLARRHLKGIATSTLEAIVGHLGNAEGRALRRAARAIQARIGSSQLPEQNAAQR